MLSITWHGVPTLQRQFAKLVAAGQGKDAKKMLRKATREVAKMMQRPIKRNLQRDTGQAKRATRVRAMKRSRTRIGAQVANDEKWYKGDDYYYAFQEFGWNIGKRSGADIRAQRSTRKAGRAAGDVLRSGTRRWKEGTHRFEKAAKAKESSASRRLQNLLADGMNRLLKAK